MDFPAPKRVVPHFIDRIFAMQPLRLSGEGSQTRSFSYVHDMIRGMVQALAYAARREETFSECFNLGSSQPITMRALAETVVALSVDLGIINRPLPILPNAFHYTQRFDDTWNRIPDISHAQSELGFKPGVSIKDGLRQTLIYYKGLRGTAVRSIAATT
jgi:UDP-glucuronate decarboxylase